jgi:hypothetical protein
MRPDLERLEERLEGQRLLLRKVAGRPGQILPLAAGDEQYRHVRSAAVQLQIVRWSENEQCAGAVTRDQLNTLPLAFVTTEQNTWVSLGRTGRVDRKLHGFAFVTTGAQETWVGVGRPALFDETGIPHEVVPAGRDCYRLGYLLLSRAELSAFPTDPELIYERLRAIRPEQPAPSQVFGQLHMALQAFLPAALRVGVYQALPLVPGVRIVRDACDGLGRPGVLVCLAAGHQEQQLIVDRHSFALLGERVIVAGGDGNPLSLPVGTATRDLVYIEHAVTDAPCGPGAVTLRKPLAVDLG